jgi:peptide/nickel transport system permease protein
VILIARFFIIIGTGTMLMSGIIGTTLAVLGAYFGRSLDRVAMFIVSCRFAIPLVSPIGSSLALRHVSVGAFRGCFSPYLRSWT